MPRNHHKQTKNEHRRNQLVAIEGMMPNLQNIKQILIKFRQDLDRGLRQHQTSPAEISHAFNRQSQKSTFWLDECHHNEPLSYCKWSRSVNEPSTYHGPFAGTRRKSVCMHKYTEQKKLRKSQKTMQHKNTKANNYSIFIYLLRYMSMVEKHVYFKLLAPMPLLWHNVK